MQQIMAYAMSNRISKLLLYVKFKYLKPIIVDGIWHHGCTISCYNSSTVITNCCKIQKQKNENQMTGKYIIMNI